MSQDPSEKICGLNRNIFFTGLVSFFMDFSSEMVYPLVPLFLSSVLGVPKSVIGLIEGIAESTASLLKVFSGWLSDRLGHRKWLMAAGYAISTLSRPLIATAPNWGQVLASRFMDRFGKGIRNAPRDALIAESCEVSNLGRSFGFHRGMDTLGAVVGPAVAFGLLAYFNGQYRLVFWLSMIPGALAVLTIIFFIRETRACPLDPAEKPRLAWSGFDGTYKYFIMVATLFSLGNSSDVFLILRAQNVGIPAAVIPLVYLVFNVVYGLGALPAGILIGPYRTETDHLSGFHPFRVYLSGFCQSRPPGPYLAALYRLWNLYGHDRRGAEGLFGHHHPPGIQGHGFWPLQHTGGPGCAPGQSDRRAPLGSCRPFGDLPVWYGHGLGVGPFIYFFVLERKWNLFYP